MVFEIVVTVKAPRHLYPIVGVSTLLRKSCNKKQENEEGIKHKNE